MNNNDGKNNISTRQLILQTASRLMMEQGVTSTSLADIAREANISKGTLHYYYPSKSDLIYDITQEHFSLVTISLINWMEQARGQASFADIIKVVVNSFLEAETRTKLHLYLLQEAVLNNEDLKVRFQDTYREWRKLIKDELDKQADLLGFTDEEARALSFMLVAIIDGLIIQRMVGGDSIPLHDIADYLGR
ncbi:MAG: TetR/AcrR family transcriptional regulator [Syntrophomonadaceae bacterium]|nr:TetR/AcrR family transcriptional regulator [Syntrophomonadaceae bacterium]